MPARRGRRPRSEAQLLASARRFGNAILARVDLSDPKKHETEVPYHYWQRVWDLWDEFYAGPVTAGIKSGARYDHPLAKAVWMLRDHAFSEHFTADAYMSNKGIEGRGKMMVSHPFLQHMKEALDGRSRKP